MAEIYLGIDLGTTESTVSVIEIDGFMDDPIEKLRDLNIYQYNSKFELEKDLKGLQSSIYIDRDNKKVYTGEYAKVLYANGNKPLNTIRSVKTRIGGESMIQVPQDSDKSNLESYGMTELSALLLKTIKESVGKQISGDFKSVTVTIPAGFNSDERDATISAAEMAGFKDIHLLDEPTAVLLNFLNSDDVLEGVIDDDFFEESKNILVYDIGGGTLDISIAKIVDDEEGDFEVDILGRSKRMDFGGDDIDKYIASYFLSEFEKINPSIEERTLEEQAKIVSRIVSNAEKVKKDFSMKITRYLDHPRRPNIKETVNFEIIDNLKITDITIKDERLKEILSTVIADYGNLLNPLRNSLQESKLKKEDIDLVILTGGSGKFYLVEETLRNFFGDELDIIEFTQNNAVSRGAVMHSHNQDNEDLKKINISDIMSNSVFIRNGSKFDMLIPHDTKIETEGVYEYVFDKPTHRLEVFLYYGAQNEDKSKFKEVAGIFKELPNYYKKGDKIELKWIFDENKVISIYFEDEILINTSNTAKEKHELIDDFVLNP